MWVEDIKDYDERILPSDFEEKSNLYCVKCGEELEMGEYHYDIDGEIWCEYCFEKKYKKRTGGE